MSVNRHYILSYCCRRHERGASCHGDAVTGAVCRRAVKQLPALVGDINACDVSTIQRCRSYAAVEEKWVSFSCAVVIRESAAKSTLRYQTSCVFQYDRRNVCIAVLQSRCRCCRNRQLPHHSSFRTQSFQSKAAYLSYHPHPCSCLPTGRLTLTRRCWTPAVSNWRSTATVSCNRQPLNVVFP